MASWEPVLEALVATRHRDLVAYARMLTGNRSAAEDLVQDALIETFGGRRRFSHVLPAETYTRRVIASRYIDSTRRKASERRAYAKVGAVEFDPGAGPDVAVEHRTDVERALDLLTPRERACVVMRYLHHQSITETAVALGLSEGAVKRYVHDGIVKLNAAMGTDSNPEEIDMVSVDARRN
jgi:RNA polymerase sigma factor (sigma-70 family)